MNPAILDKNIQETKEISLNWQDNPAIQKLLDIAIEVMAEEYVKVARNNEEVFSG